MDNNNTAGNVNPNLTVMQAADLPQENFLQIAVRHRWTILSAIVFFLAAGFIYVTKATPIYTSTSRLYVEQTGPKIITEYEGVMTRSKNYLYTQAGLIKSTPIIASVVDDPAIKQFRTFDGVDNLMAYVKRNLDVAIGKKDDIIAVSFDSPYPQEAAQIVNAAIDSYINYHSTYKRTTASEVLNILQKEKVKRDKELSDKFAEMLEFTRKNGVVAFDTKGGHIVFERLSKLSEALTEAQLATINAKADYEATKNMANEPAKIKQFAAASPALGVRIFVNDLETQLLSQLKDAEVELKNARYHCTEDHPSVQAIRAKIDYIRQQLNEQAKEFAGAYTEVVRLRYATAKQKEEELQTSFDSQRQAAQDLGIKVTEYSVLQSELKRLENLCEILDNRIKELNVTEDAGALNISVLETARPADRPSEPQKAKILGIALILGIMFSCGLAALRDWLDYRLRSAEEVSAILGVPVLGVVPTMSDARTILTRGQKGWLKLTFSAAEFYGRIRAMVLSVIHTGKEASQKQTLMERAAAYRAMRTSMLCGVPVNHTKTTGAVAPAIHNGKTVSEKPSGVTRGQKVFLEPRSAVAEAYRTIRTAVFFGAPRGKAKTIAVTSPAPGDGKSTLVSNLAIAMGQAGQKTLVIDGDFRKPMQHKIFELDDKKGLSCVLAGTHTLDAAIQPGPVKDLDVLPRGPDVPNPSELLNSDAFAEMLRDLSNRYDRIIIDSPPVGPVADSQILAALCDTVLLVLRAQTSTRRHSQQARDGLLSVGAHILGAVVNDVPRKRGHYGYYSGYGYYRGYGYHSYYGYYGDREKKAV